MRRLLTAAFIPLLLYSAPSSAQIPLTLSYQGVLTDAAGTLVADGNYSLTFSLYAASSGGSALWSETQPAVALARGGFSVLLGAVNPLAAVFDRALYLGVAVGAGAELAPRVALAPSPYALGLRLPWSGLVTSSGPALTIRNLGPGPDVALEHLVQVGTAIPAVRLSRFSGFGGSIDAYDEGGILTGGLEADVTGEGGFLFTAGNVAASKYFYVDGNSNGLGDPRLDLLGGSSAVTFNTGASGDFAVQLPTGSINAGEILDESGIALGHLAGVTVALNLGPAMLNVVSVTLVTPSAGYVVVRAHATHQLAGDGANRNYSTLQISENVLGSPEAGQLTSSGYTTVAPATVQHVPVSLERAYFKSAGSYTFYLQAVTSAAGTFTSSLYNPMISATYFPTSYGAVTASADAKGPLGAGSAGATGGVDLRELEQRVAREKAAVAETERQLSKARLDRQIQGRP